MAIAHISQAEAARDVVGLLALVRAGEEIVIEEGNIPVAVISPVDGDFDRLHSKSVARTDENSKRPGFDWESLKRDRDEGRP